MRHRFRGCCPCLIWFQPYLKCVDVPTIATYTYFIATYTVIMSTWALFYIYETNADLEPVVKIDKGFYKDILETRMFNAFVKGNCAVDYMLYNATTQEIASLLLTDRSKLLRGECLS